MYLPKRKKDGNLCIMYNEMIMYCKVIEWKTLPLS